MIQRFKHEWGDRLLVRPFTTAKFSNMTIQADVHRPTKGARREVFVNFYGTSGDSLLYSDARTWQAAYAAILAEVDKVVEEFKPKKKKKR